MADNTLILKLDKDSIFNLLEGLRGPKGDDGNIGPEGPQGKDASKARKVSRQVPNEQQNCSNKRMYISQILALKQFLRDWLNC